MPTTLSLNSKAIRNSLHSIFSSLFSILYPDLTVYTCWSSPTHFSLFCPSLFHWTLDIRFRNCFSNYFSHSNLSLLQLRFQLVHLPLQLCPQSTRSYTSLSLFCKILNNIGNSSFNTLSFTHLSSQNLTFHPSPKVHCIRLSNQFPCSSFSHTRHKSCHYEDCFLWTLFSFIFLQSLYLDVNISLHNPSPIFPNLYFHLARRILKTPDIFDPQSPNFNWTVNRFPIHPSNLPSFITPTP